MSQRYKQNAVTSGVTRFTRSPMSEVEMSRMSAPVRVTTTFNAGDIVPLHYEEVLPHSTFRISVSDIIRQATTLRPTMDSMLMDYIAVWMPNRIVNASWVNVQGENTSGFWSAPVVNLAPLYTGTQNVQIPIGSVADYYGFPTQRPIKASILQQCNDLKFRGYILAYNELFRDQNYQTPIPFSRLNVYEGFLDPVGTIVQLNGAHSSANNQFPANGESDGSFVRGAVNKTLYGEGGSSPYPSSIGGKITTWSALDRPLKANKLHDWITSALPSPQKGAEVYFGIGDVANVTFDTKGEVDNFASGISLQLATSNNMSTTSESQLLAIYPKQNGSKEGYVYGTGQFANENEDYTKAGNIQGTNLVAVADLSTATGISVNDLRTAIATQQVYEQLARGGSKYRSVIASFFDLDTENVFTETPVVLGRYRHELDLYQVAQTSATSGENATGDLSAYGYTATNGYLFDRTFIEHGYIHIFGIVRHRNVYTTYFAPDNFRRGTLDFYLPPFANIGEQPIRLATLNPFVEEEGRALGFQEPWWEYRFSVDKVSGSFRSMPADRLAESLNVWNYADDFDGDFEVVTGDWLKSNSEEVLNRTLDTPSEIDGVRTGYPQFKGQFVFHIEKQLPMPVYSVPGMDII